MDGLIIWFGSVCLKAVEDTQHCAGCYFNAQKPGDPYVQCSIRESDRGIKLDNFISCGLNRIKFIEIDPLTYEPKE